MADLHFRAALLPQGWTDNVRLTLRAGLIATIETDTPPRPTDDRHAIGLPGTTNLHSHAFQRAMAGLTETRGPQADSFWTWREQMYRFALTMSPDDAEAIAAQAYLEMLESGFTTVAEFHYLHHAPDGRAYDNPAEMAARIAAAADQTGIGLTLLPVFYAHGGFGARPTEPAQRRFVTTPDSYATLFDRCRPLPARLGTAPHFLRAATPAEITTLAGLHDGPIHIHVAEQQREVADCLAATGQRPIEHLFAHTEIDRRWCLIHATHANPAEVAAIARSGATVGLCPLTEANLGDGIMPAASLAQAGGRYGVGTDSNIRISLPDELATLEYGQRLATQARNVMSPAASTGAALFHAALTGGAQAAGLPRHGLQPGAQADIVSLDARHPALIGRTGNTILDSWIFAARPGLIDRVWSAGTEVVTHGTHHQTAAITARYRTTMERLLRQ